MRAVRIINVLRHSAILFSLGSLLLSGCSTYRPAPEAFHAAIAQPYLLDAGDRLRITVFEQTGLTGTYSVDKAGQISFPLVGNVNVRHKTIAQTKSLIAQRLRNGYIRDPDVSVEVDRYRPFFIMGEVGTSGQYTYVPGMTVQNAISVANGFTPRANQENVDITRHVTGNIVTGRVEISDPILPGDNIYVRERLF